jgi:hypothetical protein
MVGDVYFGSRIRTFLLLIQESRKHWIPDPTESGGYFVVND